MLFKIIIFFYTFFYVSCELNSWILTTQYNEVLPEGVQLFQSSTKKWPELGAWLVTADISKFRESNGWDVQTYVSLDEDDNLSSVREFAEDYDAKLAINGGFFGVSGDIGVSYSLAQANSVNLSPNIAMLNRNGEEYYPTRCGFGVDDEGVFESYWVYQHDCDSNSSSCKTWAYDSPSPNSPNNSPAPKPNATYPVQAKDWNLYSGVGGSPMLVYEGKNVAMTSFEAEVTWGAGIPSVVSAPRTAVGVGTPLSLSLHTEQLLWIIVDGYDDTTGISLPDLAEEFKKLGASTACNLDGGGSSQIVVDKRLINNPLNSTYEREVAASVTIR